MKKIIQQESIIIEFYNELVMCVTTAEMTINNDDRIKFLSFLGDINKLFVGEYNLYEIANSSDAFDYSIDEARFVKGAYKIPIISIGCKLSNIGETNIKFVGVQEAHDLNIGDKDEGGVFEKQVWTSLENLFKFGVFLNPNVLENDKLRELTDILAFYELGVFLFETKALGVLTLEKEQSMERKIANTQKQIKKAIGQLVGANKKLMRNAQIFTNDKDKKEIHFDKNIIPHCIVLISELLPFGDWKVIEIEIAKTMIAENIYLHILDFREFVNFIKAADGEKENFDYYLMQRAESFGKELDIHLRTKFSKTILDK